MKRITMELDIELAALAARLIEERLADMRKQIDDQVRALQAGGKPPQPEKGKP